VILRDPISVVSLSIGRGTKGGSAAPAILVDHSYGGTLITAAGTDDRVAGLVYIAALASDAGETSQSQQMMLTTSTAGAS
jgi:pimeloyl-ACP methyl ester carboxylesterase